MIRIAKPTDLPALREIAASTEMFLGDELESFMSELQSHLAATDSGTATEATLLVAHLREDADDASVIGAAYFTSEVMAQGVMNLLFIGVLPKGRQRGVGHALLRQFEEVAMSRHARLAIIETASDEMFAPAWSLYRNAGYTEVARIPDYYDDGLDKLIFRKRL